MRKIYKWFLKGKILIYLVRSISFIFCFTLGSISLFVFSVAGTHFAKVGAGGNGDKLSYLFTSIGLIAVAVAVLDLAVTIFREMVMPEGDKRHPSRVRGSLTRFIMIVIIAVLIEGLIMLFKFSETEQIHLLPYVFLVFASALILIIGLGVYIKITVPIEKLVEKGEENNSSFKNLD
ncbi:hypothetical protein NLC82_05620 [Candidatus Aminicenantes bacterium AC-335-A11]|nr:hypothetical protein [SCandidatus Aminicenantes bacterium Aminicenantia_JdfR_composite]MCP2618884.1 hypothetical protein [Candidatus Aminicenantes bacterium AC-335-A11]